MKGLLWTLCTLIGPAIAIKATSTSTSLEKQPSGSPAKTTWKYPTGSEQHTPSLKDDSGDLRSSSSQYRSDLCAVFGVWQRKRPCQHLCCFVIPLNGREGCAGRGDRGPHVLKNLEQPISRGLGRLPGLFAQDNSGMVSWGLNSRSQPSARKALGSSSKMHTTVYVCEVCGSEHVQWVGRCPTCKEWNCVKPIKVRREGGGFQPSRRTRSSLSSTENTEQASFGSGDLEFAGGFRPGVGSRGDGGWLPEQDFAVPVRISDVGRAKYQERLALPGSEIPRVLGGGLVPGSLVMLGGDPGVGKSTLLLQLAGQLASRRPTELRGQRQETGASGDDSYVGGQEARQDTPRVRNNRLEEELGKDASSADPPSGAHSEWARAGPVVYVSGEENNNQVASRAARMGIGEVDLFLYCETDIDIIIDQLLDMQPNPALVMIDSIQTMKTGDSASSPGSVIQVKECASRLVYLAKGSGITVFIVGHVTKSGSIAGPKVVEHMVDTVLYLEGDRFNAYRLLRSVKNRFGPSNEIGVLEMTARGLEDVADPSLLFLSTRHTAQGDDEAKDMDGAAVCVYMEGSRPILCELQALVTFSRLPSPRRASDGVPMARLLLLLAVLQKRLGYQMASREVYLNIVGGLKVQETAADLAVALAVVSSYTGIPVRSDTCFIGELGLGGEVRQVQQLPRRIQEAETFGFSRVVVPFTPKQRETGLRETKSRRASASTSASGRASLGNAEALVGNAGGDRNRRGTIEVVECRNIAEAVAQGLTAVPNVRFSRTSKRSPSSGAGSRGRIWKQDYDADHTESHDVHEDRMDGLDPMGGLEDGSLHFSEDTEGNEPGTQPPQELLQARDQNDRVDDEREDQDSEDEDDGAESRWWYGVS